MRRLETRNTDGPLEQAQICYETIARPQNPPGREASLAE